MLQAPRDRDIVKKNLFTRQKRLSSSVKHFIIFNTFGRERYTSVRSRAYRVAIVSYKLPFYIFINVHIAECKVLPSRTRYSSVLKYSCFIQLNLP